MGRKYRKMTMFFENLYVGNFKIVQFLKILEILLLML